MWSLFKKSFCSRLQTHPVDFRRGIGEYITFVTFLFVIAGVALTIVGFAQLSSSLNELTKAANVVGRASAICGTLEGAEATAKSLVGRVIMQDSHLKKPKVEVKTIEKDAAWENGCELLVTVSADIKTLSPFTNGRRSKSVLVTVELEDSIFGFDDIPIGNGSVAEILKTALKIANNEKIGYNNLTPGFEQYYGNPDLDCGFFVRRVLYYAGIRPDAYLEPNEPTWMANELHNCGFQVIPYNPLQLKPGDILITSGHTEIYAGNMQLVGAHQQHGHPWPGDHNDMEVSVCGFFDDGWQYMCRYIEKEKPDKKEASSRSEEKQPK